MKWWGGVVIVLIFILVGSLFAALILGILYGLEPERIISSNIILQYTLPMIPVMLYICLIAYRAYIENQNKLIEGIISEGVKINSSNSREIKWFLWIIIAIATLSIGYAIDPIMSRVETPEALKAMYQKMSNGNLSHLISIVILAPLCEEFIFRGIIQRGMHKYYPPVVCISVAALLFGVTHLNLLQAIGGFLIGVFIGYIYYKTHNIWIAILVHFINNGSSYLTALLLPEECATMNFTEMLEYYHISNANSVYMTFIIANVVISILCIYLLNKYLPKGNSFIFKEQR